MKQLIPFTLTVLTLTLLALHGIAKMRVSLDATANEAAKTYLKVSPAESFPEIEFSNKTTEEIEMEGR